MDNLREFYFGGAREDVKSALMAHIDKVALQMAWNGEDPRGLKISKDAIDGFFSELKSEFDESLNKETRQLKR